jgi:protein arginine kinase
MIVNDLVKHQNPWISLDRETGIVVSSRVRLARNLRDHAFPGWAGEKERERLCLEATEACRKVPRLADAAVLDMAGLGELDRELLKERHLISVEFAERREGSALVLSRDEHIAIMVNEEDHLRMQAIAPGLCLQETWREIDSVDTEMEKHLRYAHSPTLGYLTACPTNVGTGLRASVMVHLAGLRLTGDFDRAMKGLTRLGLAVRGLFGEGSEAYGGMVQVSNQSTLGESEQAILERLLGIVQDLVVHERNARARLVERNRIVALDQVSRALAILKHARLISSMEAVELLSMLRLGVDLKLVAGVSEAGINEMLLMTQPGHLQMHFGRKLDLKERDRMRAEFVAERLRDADVVERRR